MINKFLKQYRDEEVFCVYYGKGVFEIADQHNVLLRIKDKIKFAEELLEAAKKEGELIEHKHQS